jgi:hypothetical protein
VSIEEPQAQLAGSMGDWTVNPQLPAISLKCGEISMAKEVLSIEVYTAGYRILGRVKPGGVGLFSFINVPTHSYIVIEDAHMTRVQHPGKMVARNTKIWLVKRDIVAVVVSGKGEIGPAAVARRGYASTDSHRVLISLAGYELTGTIETAGKFQFGSVMFEGDRLFSALYDAELIHTTNPLMKASSSALLYNRARVESMALLPQESGS